MRIRFFSSLVTVVVFIAAAPCAASWDQWVWHLGASTATSSQSAHVGVAPEAADGYDALDRYLAIGPHACVGIFHIDGQNGWAGPTGFYWQDLRSPLPEVMGASKTWFLYTWIDTEHPEPVSWFALGWLSSSPPPDLLVTITLLAKPEGITEGPAVGTAWNLSAKPYGGVQLPPFKTSDGREGYLFALTATVIPEPASLPVIAAGLAVIGGVMRLRPG
ncbi:MAG: hypothetical protein KatS3mg024_1828 [Armatimonadota bacterium]|nr:MAG: hypothetical protein KatS3mg024_1828 [Armatimonadota bacterium]